VNLLTYLSQDIGTVEEQGKEQIQVASTAFTVWRLIPTLNLFQPKKEAIQECTNEVGKPPAYLVLSPYVMSKKRKESQSQWVSGIDQ